MKERLTHEQMLEKYPNQYLGINNIKYMNDDGVTIEAADIIYTDKSQDELMLMQINGTDGIICWCTKPNEINLGLAALV